MDYTDYPENAGGPPPVPPNSEYEACAPGSFPPGQMALVRAIQEKFLSAFAEDLSDRLETQVNAQLDAAKPLSRSAFLRAVESGGCLITLNAEPVHSQALIAFSPGLVAFLLGLLLGAPPSSGNDQRPVTEIELYILREIFELLAHQLTNAWKPAGIAFGLTPAGDTEANAWRGTMLVFECRLSFGDVQETFHVAAPAFLARLAASQLDTTVVEESPAHVRQMIFNALRGGKVTVESVLPGSTLRMGDLLTMEPGHILMLAQPAGSPAECRISGKPKYRGEWISHGARQALLLL